jgi:hypothetical protein
MHMAKPFDFSDFEMSGASGMDDMLAREAHITSPHQGMRQKVASLGDLSNFVRVSTETLIHRSNRDLWSIKREGNELFIERLFDDNGEPLKG